MIWWWAPLGRATRTSSCPAVRLVQEQIHYTSNGWEYTVGIKPLAIAFGSGAYLRAPSPKIARNSQVLSDVARAPGGSKRADLGHLIEPARSKAVINGIYHARHLTRHSHRHKLDASFA